MCSRSECMRYLGQYVRFRSQYGYHEGIIERVTRDRAIILSPRRYVPAALASESVDDISMERRLDLALAWGGYGGGYGGRYGYGGGYGYGWGRWAASFLIIYVLWGLWW